MLNFEHNLLYYNYRFSHLKTAKAHGQVAPHKPLLLLAVMVIGVFVTENGVSWMVVILVCIRLVPDYYYALKYDMDELHSIEELLQKHPEAKGKIRKTFFEN